MAQCCICQDELVSPTTHGACGANFCLSCLRAWVTAQAARGEAATCPVCRGHTQQDPLQLRVNHALEEALAALAAARVSGSSAVADSPASVAATAAVAAAAPRSRSHVAAHEAAALSRACYAGDRAAALTALAADPASVHCGLPLTHACMTSLEDVAMRILDAGGAPDPPQDYGGNPLTWSCWNRLELVALRLIALGARVDFKEASTPHNTPLTNSCERGLDLVALRLIDAGADVHLRNGSGRSPLDACLGPGKEARRGMARVIAALREKGAT